MPLQKWFMAISLMVEGKKGISAAQVQRHIGMTYKTAWYVCHRIREAMQEPKGTKLGDKKTVVEIDETFVGGRKRGTGVKAGKDSKTIVMGFAERNGRIHMQVVKSRKKEDLKPVIDQTVSKDVRKIVTDGLPTYEFAISKKRHIPTSHKEELRDKNWTSTQTVENAFSLFKRGIVGNYHQLSADHLDRYLNEFCWRYNRRKMQPWLFQNVLVNMAKSKPLPYKDLTF
jgi:transposase-like protein